MDSAPDQPPRLSPDDDLIPTWRSAFWQTIQSAEFADPLRDNAVPGKLKHWTTHLTTATVLSCEAMGLQAAAKGHPLDLLPESRNEYLGLDVTAFLPSSEEMPSWPYPLIAFELENQASLDRIAYSIWKVASVRSMLGVVFAYRKTWDAASELVSSLAKFVPETYAPGWAQPAGNEIMLVVGSRSENEGFPWGYFKFWAFNRNIKQFEKL